MTQPNRRIAQQLATRAKALGACAFGITAARPVADYVRFREWLSRGLAADMAYLARNESLRADPRSILPEARSVVCVAVPYGARPVTPNGPTLPSDGADSAPGVIAEFATGPDYHRVMRELLNALMDTLQAASENAVTSRVAVDTAPLLERSLAVAAGLGAIGRHTQLLVPQHGSKVVLGVLLTSVELPADTPCEADLCGTCRACLEACPTGALRPDGFLDAGRCLSYWTTATRAPIPRAFRKAVGNRIYGCDRCQQVCPHNPPAPFPEPLEAKADRSLDDLHRLLSLSSRALKRDLVGSALDWLHRTTLLRTICVVLGNHGSAESVGPLCAALQDRDPQIRAHAAWALGALSLPKATAALHEAHSREEDPAVISEIQGALQRGPSPSISQ